MLLLLVSCTHVLFVDDRLLGLLASTMGQAHERKRECGQGRSAKIMVGEALPADLVGLEASPDGLRFLQLCMAHAGGRFLHGPCRGGGGCGEVMQYFTLRYR